jgi:choline-glycine betaine transporter
MKRTLLMPCLVVIGLAAAVLLAAGVQAGTLLVVAAALACPLMMLVMMGGMFGMARHVSHGSDSGEHPSDSTPQEDTAAPSRRRNPH